MTEELQLNNFGLLKQLEHILECDALIDEVGFIHPSQFATLDEGIVSTSEPLVDFVPQSVDEVISTSQSLDVNVLQHDSTIFWSRDHKLAISTEALLPLYNAAKHAFMTALQQYKLLVSLPNEADKLLDERVTCTTSVSEYFLENEVMRHSKALLLLSCDYGTAWNSRKLVVSKKQQFSLFMNELMLSALILSYAPKSEHAWSHRRWVIKKIDGRYPETQTIVERDSELVKKIAEKSKMNYRAWSHRCWLLNHMTTEQLINESNKSKKWSELHVADNSCFHYRQHLLYMMMKHGVANIYSFWMEELDWNLVLIKRYIGREALWLHHNEFEDGKTQSVLAAAYIIWVLKQFPNARVIRFQGEIKDMGELKVLLNKLCPEKTRLWDDLIG
ncbi:hypothetical protein ACHQM5_016866 [Ranunculus cassubicifolius]